MEQLKAYSQLFRSKKGQSDAAENTENWNMFFSLVNEELEEIKESLPFEIIVPIDYMDKDQQREILQFLQTELTGHAKVRRVIIGNKEPGLVCISIDFYAK